MKKLFVFITAAIVAVACNQRTEKTAGEKPVDVTQDSTNFTTIQWLDDSLNLGTVQEGAQVDVSFRFKNTGDKPLIISNVSAGCGCTVPETPKKPFQPGEEGMIQAKFNSEGRVGVNHKTVTVIANTKGTTSHILSFEVKVEGKENKQQ
ncbi:MAG: DUF1573 domain-containing protein [Chitinophagaceae bacterium]